MLMLLFLLLLFLLFLMATRCRRTNVVSSSRRSASAPTFAASGSARRCKAFSRRRGRLPAPKFNNNNNNNHYKEHYETAGTNCGSSFEISLLPARRRILSHNQPELLFHVSVIFPARERKIASICVLKYPFFCRDFHKFTRPDMIGSPS